MAEFYLRIPGDISIEVPSSLRQLTTYVLIERDDWFENEIRFLRHWLSQGMRAVDVGANYGMYALSIAKAVGPSGRVWAFEPTRTVADTLRRSIAKNGFDNLVLQPLALSSREGAGKFFTYPNSEMNSFTSIARTADIAQVEVVEEVAISTLDRLAETQGWDRIDFVKIDTEGEELRVVEGGRDFFSRQSPLVMFEIPNTGSGSGIAALVGAFQALGYDCYHLIGPDSVLVPVTPGAVVDAFESNFFACKPDRAASLAAAGLLVQPDDLRSPPPAGDAQALFVRQLYAPAFGAVAFADEQYRSALDSYAAWRAPEHGNAARYAALGRAFELVRAAAKVRPTISRLSSLARIAREASARMIAVEAIGTLVTQLAGAPLPPDEPFFPASPRFDTIDPQQSARAWLLAASFEAYEETRLQSGYFGKLDDRTADLYEWFSATPFHSAGMERRRQLLRLLAGRQSKLLPIPLLVRSAPDNLNADFWAKR